MAKSNTPSKEAQHATLKLKDNRIVHEFGGLLFAFGICTTYFRFAWITALINGNGETANSGIALANLIGWLFAILIGFCGSIIGFFAMLGQLPSQFTLKAFLIFEQTAWLPFLTEIVDYALRASGGVWPEPLQTIHQPTPAEVKLGAAMDISK